MSKLNRLLSNYGNNKFNESSREFVVMDISQGLIQTYYGATTNNYCNSGSNSGCTNNQCETGGQSNSGCSNPNCCEK